MTQPVTRAFGWCLHCVLRVEGTPKSSSDGALISSCSGAEIAPLCELGRWGGWGAGLFLRCLNVPVAVAFVPLVIDVPPLPSAVVSGNFSRISSFSCCMFVFYGNNIAQPDLRSSPHHKRIIRPAILNLSGTDAQLDRLFAEYVIFCALSTNCNPSRTSHDNELEMVEKWLLIIILESF